MIVAPLHNPVPNRREHTAVAQTRSRPTKAEPITGTDPITYDPSSVTATFDRLNEYQTEAAKRALAAEQVTCIHGPPGTGKTRTLISLICQLVAEGKRVLACAHSNQATDNLLVGSSAPDHTDPDSLHARATAGEFTIARVGSGTNNRVVATEYADRPPSGADVVGTTMNAAATFDVNEFDVAIVDEATQASIPASLIPYATAERIILAGDHKQLPPYASNDLQEREMELSLFEHLMDRYGDGVSTLLCRQYRMHEQSPRSQTSSSMVVISRPTSEIGRGRY